MANGTSTMQTKALRQQLREQLGAGIRQTEDMIQRYREAYPNFDQVDWPAVQEQLAQPSLVSRLPVHPEAEASWQQLYGQRRASELGEVEPIAFGSLADPVSQAAFLLAPGLLRGGKAVLETAGSPGPRFGGLASERGNLGPVPRGVRGEPLPQSVMRDEQGKLKRFYHGTERVYPDFEMGRSGTGAGGNLYGPGIYMTDNPEVAGGSQAMPTYEQLGYASPYANPAALPAWERDIAQMQDTLAWMRNDPRRQADVQAMERVLQQTQRQASWARAAAPNVRSVYPNFRNPIDLREGSGMTSSTLAQALVEGGEKQAGGYLLATYGRDTPMTGHDAYRAMRESLLQYGTRPPVPEGVPPNVFTATTERDAEAQLAQVLQQAGYDGLLHTGMGGASGPHTVALSWSPEQVYPAANVEGSLPMYGPQPQSQAVTREGGP